MSIKIDLPLFITLPRKTKADKKMIINLNNYRNWHYITSNQTKEAYKEQIRPMLDGVKFDRQIRLHFIYFKPSARRSDRSNVLSIQEKFFCDALVECGCIPDDNDDIIIETRYSGGSIDRENPRVEVYIN